MGVVIHVHSIEYKVNHLIKRTHLNLKLFPEVIQCSKVSSDVIQSLQTMFLAIVPSAIFSGSK